MRFDSQDARRAGPNEAIGRPGGRPSNGLAKATEPNHVALVPSTRRSVSGEDHQHERMTHTSAHAQ
jgi:hypothetical protein